MTETASEFVLSSVEAIPPGEGRTFDLNGERIAVFRTRTGQVYAVQAECPHRGGPLADGLVGGSTLICPLHSWKFDLSTGAALMGSCGLKIYPVHIDSQSRILITI